jgi:hypothetical protein
VIAFSLQIDVTNAINGQTDSRGGLHHASCFSTSLLLMEQLEKNNSVSRPEYAILGLLLVSFITDSAFAIITLVCIVKLRNSVNTHSNLLKEFLQNSVMVSVRGCLSHEVCPGANSLSPFLSPPSHCSSMSCSCWSICLLLYSTRSPSNPT